MLGANGVVLSGIVLGEDALMTFDGIDELEEREQMKPRLSWMCGVGTDRLCWG